jgi:hypothetical protein
MIIVVAMFVGSSCDSTHIEKLKPCDAALEDVISVPLGRRRDMTTLGSLVITSKKSVADETTGVKGNESNTWLAPAGTG